MKIDYEDLPAECEFVRIFTWCRIKFFTLNSFELFSFGLRGQMNMDMDDIIYNEYRNDFESWNNDGISTSQLNAIYEISRF